MKQTLEPPALSSETAMGRWIKVVHTLVQKQSEPIALLEIQTIAIHQACNTQEHTFLLSILQPGFPQSSQMSMPNIEGCLRPSKTGNIHRVCWTLEV